jgi:type II secretory ATPase GspE/PulE/Tfp pilus assembly ATPase PilB-like protein
VQTLADIQAEIASHSGGKDVHRISHILEVVMGGALALGASDVHLEPEEKDVRMRYRLDGVLVEVLAFDHETYGSFQAASSCSRDSSST